MLQRQLLTKIKNLVQSDDPTYQPIAEYLYYHWQMINQINISYLAKVTNSSPATVTRFCKTLGLTGYKHLVSILLAPSEEEVISSTLLTESLQLDDKINEVIVDTAYLLDEVTLNKLIVDLTTSDDKILFLGYGESGVFLQMFASRLLRLGIQVRYFSQLEDLQVAASLIDDKTIILALSLSGQTKMVLDFVTLAKIQHAKIYSITKFENNPLKKISDFNFSISYDIQNRLISKTARYAIFFILDLIFEKILSCNPEKFLPILKQTR